ncbi:hypothetical protein BB561_000157 [Smittium simulii]|uniref:Cytochrome b5 heme-binding domain-containing protein n=1 Tax=Smittium simulii TaxID=133385 RepID=A0A2T9Z0C3_9FUNG|nr:hypothetical protein BB561_000157 [Smittium simulii]
MLTLEYILLRIQEPLNLSLLIISSVAFYLIFFKTNSIPLETEEPKHPTTLAISEYSLEELREFNGTGPTKLIFICIKDKIYDVTEKPQFYGPDGPYGSYSGRDATIALAKNSTTSEFIPKPGDPKYDLSTLNAAELEALNGWASFFNEKYQVVGSIRY